MKRVINFTDGCLRYESKQTLCDDFKISEESNIILSGVDKDKYVEMFWAMPDRNDLAERLRKLGVSIFTVPNFSTVLTVPRWNDMHSIKRIGKCWEQMMSAGLPTALHVNGRTEWDFARWAEFINRQPAAIFIAYEFRTPTRAAWHADMLCKLAAASERRLRLIVRGGSRFIPQFRECFEAICFVDTDAFYKTMYRKRAVRCGNNNLIWKSDRTPGGVMVDDLMEHNIYEKSMSI